LLLVGLNSRLGLRLALFDLFHGLLHLLLLGFALIASGLCFDLNKSILLFFLTTLAEVLRLRARLRARLGL
jgi:hypothetical protein